MKRSPERLALLAVLVVLVCGCVHAGRLAAKGAPRAAAAKGAPRLVAQTQEADVAVLRSAPSLEHYGWVGDWEQATCLSVLRDVGATVREITDKDLLAGDRRFKLLVLPNIRLMPAAEAAAIRDYYVSGGKLLATYLSSYRDEKNRAVGAGNHFQLADIFGCDVVSWANGGSICARLDAMELGRNNAMLVKPAAESQVLARWINGDGTRPGFDAGLVLNADHRSLYVGENVFAEDNSRSGEVRRFIGGLLDRLQIPRHPKKGWDATSLDLAIPYPANGPVPPGRGPVVRVGLDVVPSLWITSPHGFRIVATEGNRLDPAGRSELDVPGGVQEVRSINTVFKAPTLAIYDPGGKLLARCAGSVRVEPEGETTSYVLTVGLHANGTGASRGYRGRLHLVPTDHGVQEINEISLEGYVAGVVPNEMAPYFPPSALDAMSVIARTFALSHLKRHESEGFDVCPTVHCQVYGGLLSERPSSNAATVRTAGEVVYYHDRPADTTFHAVCGGVGERVENVWNVDPQPYLEGYVDGPGDKAVDLSSEPAFRHFIDTPPDSYCHNSARFRWTESYTLADLDRLFQQSLPVTLKDSYHDIGTIRDLRVTSRSRGGRVQTLEIAGTRGTCVVHKDAIRWLWSGGKIGTGGLQSTLFYVDVDSTMDPPQVKIHGGGWGHGVGMCQDGAGGMAEAGLDYRTIIKHYYPGVEIRPLPEN